MAQVILLLIKIWKDGIIKFLQLKMVWEHPATIAELLHKATQLEGRQVAGY